MKITSGEPELIARGTDSVQQYFFYSFQALLWRKQLCSWYGCPKVNQVRSQLFACLEGLLSRNPHQLWKEAAEGWRVPLASLSWAGKSYRAPHQSAITQGKSSVF